MKRYYLLIPFIIACVIIIIFMINTEQYRTMYLTCLDGEITIISHRDNNPNRGQLNNLCNTQETMLANDIKKINDAELDEPVEISELTYELLNIASVAYYDTDSRFNIGNGYLIKNAEESREYLMLNNHNNFKSLEIEENEVIKTENLILNLHNLKTSFIVYQLSMDLAEQGVTDYAIITNNLMLAKGDITDNYTEYPSFEGIIAVVTKTNQDLIINQFSFNKLDNISSITVITNDIIKAEILATTLLYDKPEDILRITENTPNTFVRIVDNEDQIHQSFPEGA